MLYFESLKFKSVITYCVRPCGGSHTETRHHLLQCPFSSRHVKFRMVMQQHPFWTGPVIVLSRSNIVLKYFCQAFRWIICCSLKVVDVFETYCIRISASFYSNPAEFSQVASLWNKGIVRFNRPQPSPSRWKSSYCVLPFVTNSPDTRYLKAIHPQFVHRSIIYTVQTSNQI